MRVLVTGNRGYVGSHVVNQLRSAGHFVVGVDLDLFPRAVCGELIEPDEQHNMDFRRVDLSVLKEIESVIHLAAISNDPMGNISKQLTMEINGYGTIELARRAKKVGVKSFVLASSCSVYGAGFDKPRIESDAIKPLSAYAESKVFAELGLCSMAAKDFNVYALRIATAYGVSSVFRADLVLNQLISNIVANGVAELTSDGSPWRPLINCRDMASALILFATHNPDFYSGRPINVGFNSDNFQISEIAKMIEGILPKSRVIMSKHAPKDPRSYKVDFSLLQEIFPGFGPETDIRTHLYEMVEFLEEIDFSQRDVFNNRFVRLSELLSSSKFESLLTE